MLSMKRLVCVLIGLLIVTFPGLGYTDQKPICGDDKVQALKNCPPQEHVYIVPKGSMYASRIHSPRKIPREWCPNKRYKITRAELEGNIFRSRLIDRDKSCQRFKRYTANFWAGDPYCLDNNFEMSTQPDWQGDFYACAGNINVKKGKKYFLVYAVVGNGLNDLGQKIDKNRVVNSDTGESQRGFVSFMIIDEREVPPVVKNRHSQEENVSAIDDVIQEFGRDALYIDCQVRPHDPESNKKFDAFVSVTERRSGQEIVAIDLVENTDHEKARKELDSVACKDIKYFGY